MVNYSKHKLFVVKWGQQKYEWPRLMPKNLDRKKERGHIQKVTFNIRFTKLYICWNVKLFTEIKVVKSDCSIYLQCFILLFFILFLVSLIKFKH